MLSYSEIEISVQAMYACWELWGNMSMTTGAL